MKNILVAIDDSEPSLKAVRMAAELAAAMGVKLVLAHSVVPVALPADFYGMASVEFHNQAVKEGEALLARVAEQLAGTPVERRLLRGPAAETIAETAEGPDIGLVVVGSRGRGAVARVLLGSVADRLVHICRKPVLVVH